MGRILQFAAVVYGPAIDSKRPKVYEVNEYVNPVGVRTQASAYNVHGITHHMTEKARCLAHVWTNFVTALLEASPSVGDSKCVLVAYNGNAFDFRFLACQLMMANVCVPDWILYTMDPYRVSPLSLQASPTYPLT